ncbi:phospholipid/cholesterol/gamma-HCH transport system substrate-binding protein [Mycobacterium sp. BK086]|uniref:MCE family protein n=1 Tax=Mycobacterium sp. BK086 TaxID=2512165 RepID=UPI001061EF28|nr:MCE family protein [Mycobacterium sp. BK086]TDO09946.1 phospholipid/cholesterol/gamma-HCH transport system substrate-binding protein [Mycobacterium sp. BK086]
MEPRSGDHRLHPAWWTLILVVVVASLFATSGALFTGAFTSYVPVTLTADRAGLVMESGGKVMMNGVAVGRVAGISRGSGPVRVRLEISPDQIKYIPANVSAQIRATTAFGAKFVDLIYPEHPSSQRLAAGAVLVSRNVTTEVNTVFENLVGLLHQIDPAKLNAVLSALSEGFRGQGERIGQAITDADQVLREVNPRADTIDQNWRLFNSLNGVYDAATPDVLRVLDAAATTSETITRHATALDALLLNTAGFSQAAIDLLAPNQKNLVSAVNLAAPTTGLLLTYNPEYTCTLEGAKWWLDNGARAAIGGNGRTYVADAAILMGDDPYSYPENLPIVAAKGGPGGKPGCGSLPDATKMFPVRQLVTNTGWGTGVDIRPNPGIGHPCYADYLPATRAVPQKPSIRQCLPGPAPGPVPYPGAPPYGAPLYGPGGVPLWPGIPPAPAPPPVPVEGTPVAPGTMSPQPPPPAVFGGPPPLQEQPNP